MQRTSPARFLVRNLINKEVKITLINNPVPSTWRIEWEKGRLTSRCYKSRRKQVSIL